MQPAPPPDDAIAVAKPKAATGRQPLEIEPPDKRTPKAVLIVAGIAALNSANLGYDIGVMAGAAGGPLRRNLIDPHRAQWTSAGVRRGPNTRRLLDHRTT